MRLLMTGASGFLGRHVVAAAADHTVVRLTRTWRTTDAGELALGPTPWTQEHLLAALTTVQPDVVIHCAGTTRTWDARDCFDANTVLAAELLDAAAGLAKPPRVILIGSAAEYGAVPAEAQPVTEIHPCAPRTLYGVSKHAQSLLAFASAIRGLPVLVARLFNAVGAGMPGHLALPSFARRIIGSEARSPLRVGDLSAERDFLDVDEAARLLLGLAALPSWPWPVVHLCSGRAYRIGDLLNQLIELAGVSIQIQPDQALMRPGDPRVLIGSTKRLATVNLVPQAPDFSILLPLLLNEARLKGTSPQWNGVTQR